MTNFATAFRNSLGAAAVGGLLALTACGEGERTAEAETPVSEAEVSTELPETVVSDNQLEATANAAAELAARPPAQVIPVPVPAGQAQQGQAGAQGAGAGVGANQTTGTSGQ